MDINKYIAPLHVNGLNGRILHMPAQSNNAPEVLFIYGHHSSLERWQGIAAFINTQCSVTMPDLPGFGGMDSLYTIGKQATLDNLADYLAAFISQHYKKDARIHIVGMSLGFVIVTRMLQRHPNLVKHVITLISLFGFAHHADFTLLPKHKQRYLKGAKTFSLPIMHALYRTLLLNKFVLAKTYHLTPNAKEKFKNISKADHKQNMEFEISLWQQDDIRTYMKTSAEFLTLNNTTVKVDVPVYHIAASDDRYFNNSEVAKHYKHIFSSYKLLATLKTATHAPTRIATAEQAAHIIPPNLLNILNKTAA